MNRVSFRVLADCGSVMREGGCVTMDPGLWRDLMCGWMRLWRVHPVWAACHFLSPVTVPDGGSRVDADAVRDRLNSGRILQGSKNRISILGKSGFASWTVSSGSDTGCQPLHPSCGCLLPAAIRGRGSSRPRGVRRSSRRRGRDHGLRHVPRSTRRHRVRRIRRRCSAQRVPR